MPAYNSLGHTNWVYLVVGAFKGVNLDIIYSEYYVWPVAAEN